LYICLVMELKELTKAEEEVMQILWKSGKGFVKDLLEEFPKPKPAYNTVSTIIRILETKGFVDHKSFGKTFEYFPLVSKEQYSDFIMRSMMKNYFGNSFNKMVSFFTKNNKLSVKDLDELMKEIKNNQHGK
jgi:BlaI family transcriptional regulator, penicillinase repressor